jgi:hypothetical protein
LCMYSCTNPSALAPIWMSGAGRHGRLRTLGKTLLVKNGKLVHCRLPMIGCPPQSAVMLRSASQISLVAASSLGKCPRVLRILRNRAFTLSNGVGGVDHPAHLGREGKERNHLVPDPTPRAHHRGEWISIFTDLFGQKINGPVAPAILGLVQCFIGLSQHLLDMFGLHRPGCHACANRHLNDFALVIDVNLFNEST